MAAIYMWFEKDVQIWTTTLYPIELDDNLQLGVTIGECSMTPPPSDEVDTTWSVLDITVDTILLTAPPVDDDVDVAWEIQAVEVKTILLAAPPIDDDVDVSWVLQDIELINKLVTVDTPDEELKLGISIDPSGCSMTAV